MEEVYRSFIHTGARWWNLQHSPTEESFKATQFWLDPATRAVDVELVTVSPAEQGAWLRRRVDARGRSLAARYVWLNAHGPNGQVNLTSAAQASLCESFGLATAYDYFQTFVSGVASLPRTSTAESERQAFAFCFGPKLAAIWSHTLSRTSPAADVTEGIIFTQGDAVEKTYLGFIRGVPWDHRVCLSSAFLPYLFSMALCRGIDVLQRQILDGVKEIEAHTGFHGFAERKKKFGEGKSRATELMVEMSAKASGYTTKLASTGRKTDMVEQLLGLIAARAAEDSANRERLAAERGSAGDDDEVDSRRLLEAYVDVMRQRMKMQGSETDYINKRVQVQISATLHTISQNDTLANLEVAEETSKIAYSSYRDASSMKTLAFVTMVFLPGSFISALFSTQVFNWDALKEANYNGFGVSVTPQFGLYWLITIPLTLVVFLLYFAWISKLKRELDKQKKERDRMRDKLVAEQAVSSSGSSTHSQGQMTGSPAHRSSTFLDYIALRRGTAAKSHAEKRLSAV